MTLYTNSAYRVLNLLERVRRGRGDAATVVVWAEALGLDPDIAKRDSLEVQSRLAAVRAEVDAIESAMSAQPFSDSLVAPFLQRVRATVTISNLSAPWETYLKQLTPEAMLAMKFYSEILPTETEIPEEELQEILGRVTDLRVEIEAMSLTPAIKKFLLEQLRIIEKGIQGYPIHGGAALSQAFLNGLTNYMSKSPSSDKHEDVQEAAKVEDVWASLKKVGEVFIQADDAVNGYLGLLSKATTASTALLGFIS